MPTDIDRALGISAPALTLRARRAEVLATNLANADTPNYKARDIDFNAALAAAQKQLAAGGADARASRPGHIPLFAGAESAELLYRAPSQSSIDGNTVDTQKENAAFMDNAVRYQASLNFLSGRIRTLLSAIRGE